MTKPTGVGRGGPRPNSGRPKKGAPPKLATAKPKAKAPKRMIDPEKARDAIDNMAAIYADKTPEEIMELSMRALVVMRRFADAGQCAKRLIEVRRAAAPTAPGKKEIAAATAEQRVATGRFAVPPPPTKGLN